MDWRDAEARLRAADLAVLDPVLEGLHPGARVVVIQPGRSRSETDTAWIDLFRTAGRRTARALEVDPRFALVDRAPAIPGPYVTYAATVWERVTDGAR